MDKNQAYFNIQITDRHAVKCELFMPIVDYYKNYTSLGENNLRLRFSSMFQVNPINSEAQTNRSLENVFLVRIFVLLVCKMRSLSTCSVN